MRPDSDETRDGPRTGEQPRGGGSDPLIGTVLSDRYRIERIIGIGGVGSVYRATQLGLERRVAVKVLRPELLENRTALERFVREARTAAQLQHPNIVTVHDFGQMPDGRAYLVMEFLQGLNLAQWIRKRRPTDVRRAVEYLLPVCDAVGALHASGIIHRDIKPSNIMIADTTTGHSTVKVVDFGLVRPNLADGASDLTGNLVLGTPEFMAPELFTGTKPDVLTDVYALGVASYEAMTGDLPFGTGTFREMYNRHSSLTPPRPSTLRDGLPEGVDELLYRAMHKKRSRRFASAREFAEAIEATFNERAIARVPPGPPVLGPIDSEPAASPSDQATRIGTVLVVEDDDLVRDSLVAELRGHGFGVTTAADGIEAFLLLGSHKFDVIVSDVAMPNLDGMTLLRLVSEKGIRTPVILLTGLLGDRDEQLGRRLGASAIVSKPPDMAVLLRELRRALGVTDIGHAEPS